MVLTSLEQFREKIFFQSALKILTLLLIIQIAAIRAVQDFLETSQSDSYTPIIKQKKQAQTSIIPLWFEPRAGTFLLVHFVASVLPAVCKFVQTHPIYEINACTVNRND